MSTKVMRKFQFKVLQENLLIAYYCQKFKNSFTFLKKRSRDIILSGSIVQLDVL